MQFNINKGVGRPLDFFGLKNQYIILFIVGVIFAFIAFFLFKIISDFIGLLIALAIALVSYLISHQLNRKFGINGFGNYLAMRMCPQRVSIRKAINLVKVTSRKNEV